MAQLRFRIYSIIFTLIIGYNAQQTGDLRKAFSKLLLDLNTHAQSEPLETSTLLDTYDFIIIGAGSAGCTIANRLTEIPQWKVLLLEAGRNENFLMDVPLLAPLLQLTEANWKYYTEPQNSSCLAMVDGRCPWPRGKVMGGSSVLNSMIHTRGNRRDYDEWAEQGNTNWAYKDVLPYFLKSEDMAIPELAKDTIYHRTGGMLTITNPVYRTPLAKAFLEAGVETGQKILDYNGESQTGFSYIQTTIRNGTRLSTSRAFLHPIKNRPNLHINKMSTVMKIIINNRTNRAYGVEFERNGKRQTVNFKREVILSAGAINSPQILMLSGIGPKQHLKEIGIPIIKDLKVGHNLQDHIALGGLVFSVNQSVAIHPSNLLNDPTEIINYMTYHKGPLGVPSGTEALAYYNTKDRYNSPDRSPDLELLFSSNSFLSHPLFKTVFGIEDSIFRTVYQPLRSRHTWLVFPMLMKPKSVGKIMLRSNDPFEKPIIYPNYLTNKADVEVILKGIKITVRLSETMALQKYGSKLHDVPIPQCNHYVFGTDDYWRCAIKHFTQTIYHHTGTCKMGPENDKNAVVDPTLKVYGVSGIRVADASIMPTIPAAHTNAPAIMIGEKASDLIKNDWGRLRHD